MGVNVEDLKSVLVNYGAEDALQDILDIVGYPNNRKKLTDQDVRDIRFAARNGSRYVDIAERFNINPATVSRIVRGLYH